MIKGYVYGLVIICIIDIILRYYSEVGMIVTVILGVVYGLVILCILNMFGE
jgi:hypothetical protein